MITLWVVCLIYMSVSFCVDPVMSYHEEQEIIDTDFRRTHAIEENFKKNFGRPVEWALVRKYPWSTPTLEKLEVPVDVDGNPWPLDEEGKPIEK